MINRRQFIQAGMAVTAAAMDCGVAGSTEPESIRAASVLNSAFYKVIYDAAFPAAVSFAAEAQRLGATTQSIRGDVTDLWYHDLSRRWAHSAIAIAGMTTYQSMFVLTLRRRRERRRAPWWSRPRSHLAPSLMQLDSRSANLRMSMSTNSSFVQLRNGNRPRPQIRRRRI